MKDVLMEMAKDRIDEKIQVVKQETTQETKVLDIRKLMVKLEMTIEQAMDTLDIPLNQRETYAGLVNKK